MGQKRPPVQQRIQPLTHERARDLRSHPTEVEAKLWQALRGKHMMGHRFRRQQPIGVYIADFACLEAKLLVELDGGQHAEAITYDERRTAWLESQGYRVLRFWNNDVMHNMEGVLMRIVDVLSPPPQPSPLKGEGVRS
jgi:very-short-patch-repair endonuclease